MTKSTITREQLLEIIETDHVQCGEASYLARMALAAMDSESGYLPLDYLQGYKDGLEWAAQLAEANHPETGDWLYDDPIELAKAIRKGPDMPPVQPVADSEPDRNPVLAYADSYRDMAKQGVESVPIWSVITDLERNIAPLYRHAQPAPMVMQSEPAIADCDPEVYEKGVSVCLVAIQKETAEVICQNITAATGCKVDWHYFGGRVHIKALRVASHPATVVQCPFPCGWDNLNKLAIQDAALVARGLVEGELTTEAHRQAAISNNDRLLKVISACRTAMLNGGKP